MEIIAIVSVLVAFVVGFYAYRQRIVAVEYRFLVRDKDRMIASLYQDIAAKDSEIQKLNVDVTRCDELLLDTRKSISSQTSAIQSLELENRQQEQRITTLVQTIREAELESLQSKALYQTLSTVAYDVVFVLNEDSIIIAINNAAEQLFGDRNPIGEQLTDIIDSPDLEDIILNAFRETDDLEHQLMINNRYYRARTQVMRYDNFHVFIGIALQDITELVKLNRSRRDMVANISHELRTPIANIRLIIESLFYDQDRPKRKASIASIRDISRETDTLLWLVQELLDLSMIESGQAILKMVPNNLRDIVDDTVERLADQLKAKDLTVVKHVPKQLIILCDYEQTRRVILNLMRNSIKFSPEGESITIDATSDGDDIRISVFDNGPGVPDKETVRIFERFYQVDTARTKREGSGLGLAISKHIVEAHGGKIWAEGNSKGSGGRFLFTLLDAQAGQYEISVDDMRGQHDGGLEMLQSSHSKKQPNDEELEIEFVDDDELLGDDNPMHYE